jgi:hypothetical protein
MMLSLLSSAQIVRAAADFSTYRGFRFGMSLPAASKRIGASPADVRTIHKRPVVIQELDWRPELAWSPSGVRHETLSNSVLRFYGGSLFEIVSTYDSQRVEGMSSADLVEAVSRTYGVSGAPDLEIPFQSSYGETARVIARWEDADYTVDLVRTGDSLSYALVLRSRRLAALAATAIAESVRLDTIEAPQKEIDVRREKEATERLDLNKARSVNLPNFRP